MKTITTREHTDIKQKLPIKMKQIIKRANISLEYDLVKIYFLGPENFVQIHVEYELDTIYITTDRSTSMIRLKSLSEEIGN